MTSLPMMRLIRLSPDSPTCFGRSVFSYFLLPRFFVPVTPSEVIKIALSAGQKTPSTRAPARVAPPTGQRNAQPAGELQVGFRAGLTSREKTGLAALSDTLRREKLLGGSGIERLKLPYRPDAPALAVELATQQPVVECRDIRKCECPGKSEAQSLSFLISVMFINGERL